MNGINEFYIKHPYCYTGETEGYGYAFVPGGRAGIVILDLKSKRLLENFANSQSDIDESRLKLLLKNGLIINRSNTEPHFGCQLMKSQVRTFGTWLHVTNACNLSCPYCYICKDNNSMSMDVAMAYLKKLEITLKKHNINSLVIRFAGGEPLLRKNLIQTLVREIDFRFKQNGVMVTLVLITNGVLLNREWVNFIKKYGMRLCISLDGVEEWHNKTRFFRKGKGTFQMVWNNIQLCQQEHFQPTILSTITEENLDGLEALNRLLVNSGLRFRYGVYRDTGGGYKGYQDFIQKLSLILHNCYDYYADVIKSGATTFQHQLADIRIDTNRHLRCCSSGHSGVSVKHDGMVYLCQSRMNGGHIGTVQDSATLLEMIQNQQVLSDLRTKDVRDYPQCNQCQWALTCGGGCPVVNQDTYGTVATASPYCKLFKEFIPRLVDLRALSLIKTLTRGVK